MSDEDKKKERLARLRKVREENKKCVEKATAGWKASNAVRKEITGVMKGAPRTVPEIAQLSGVPAHDVLWHVTAMKKFGQVVEVEQEGGYYRYQLAGKAEP